MKKTWVAVLPGEGQVSGSSIAEVAALVGRLIEEHIDAGGEVCRQSAAEMAEQMWRGVEIHEVDVEEVVQAQWDGHCPNPPHDIDWTFHCGGACGGDPAECNCPEY